MKKKIARIIKECHTCGIDDLILDEEVVICEEKQPTLNKVTSSDRPGKKYKVNVKNDKGNIVTVHFGDPGLRIKTSDPARRKSFRARHNCDDPGPKWKARYWACKMWSTDSVKDHL
jgi:hypothetical protein